MRKRLLISGVLVAVVAGALSAVFWWDVSLRLDSERIVLHSLEEYADEVLCPDHRADVPMRNPESEEEWRRIREGAFERLGRITTPPELRDHHEAYVASRRELLRYPVYTPEGMTGELTDRFRDAEDAQKEALLALDPETLDFLERYCEPRLAVEDALLKEWLESGAP